MWKFHGTTPIRWVLDKFDNSKGAENEFLKRDTRRPLISR